MLCENEIGVKLYFEDKSNASVSLMYARYKGNYVFSSDNVEVTKENGIVVVYVKNISMAYLNQKYDVTLNVNGKNVVVSFSPTTYILKAQNCDDAKLRNITRALWLVYKAATA